MLTLVFIKSSYGQTTDSIILSKFKTTSSFSEQLILEGLKLTSKEEIIFSSMDSTTKLITIETKHSEKLISVYVYDLKLRKQLWSTIVNNSKYNVISLTNYVLLTSKHKTICLDKLKGNELWNLKSELLYVNQKNEVAFTYFSHFDKSNPNKLLEAIRLSDGKKIWKREIDRTFGWNEIFNLNDSTVMLSASGLHTINLKDGKGWDFDALSGENRITSNMPQALYIASTILTAWFSFASAGLIHTIYYFSHTSETFWNLCSNALVKDDIIYYASKQSLSAVDLKGKLIWQKKLPKEITGNSSLVFKDSMVLLINKGYASMGDVQVTYGTTYLSAFNVYSGRQYYLKQINLEENTISDFKLIGDAYYLIQKDKISCYNYRTGEFINRERIPEFSRQKNCSFIDAQNFIIDNNYNTIKGNEIDSLLYVNFPENGIIILNKNLLEVNRINHDHLFFKLHSNPNFNFYKNQDDLLITDPNLNKIASFKVNRSPTFFTNLFYYETAQEINLVDINSLKGDKK